MKPTDEMTTEEILAALRATIATEAAKPVSAPPRPGSGEGHPYRFGPLTEWIGSYDVRTSGGRFPGRFWSWRIMSDLAIGMSARRKAWPDDWILDLGPDDTLVLRTAEGSALWQPAQADLLTADWETGD